MTKPVNSGLEPGHPVAVIGAGAMGRGIAMVAAAAGHEVLLYDAVSTAAADAFETIRATYSKLVERGKLEESEVDRRLARIKPIPAISGAAGAALVIEAVIEDFDAKRDLFRQLESTVAGDTILATNTSSLSVTALGATLSSPERFAGMHFFNPAAVMPLVEIVRGVATQSRVAQALVDVARSWGKVPVTCGSSPGFIVNRVARPFYGEAMRLFAECAATPATIDALMKESGGFRMGPMELTDLIGQDVNFAVSCSVYEGFFHDQRYQPSQVQQDLVFAGRLGRKTGHGFYDYSNDAPAAEPDTAEACAAPTHVRICGDLGPANVLPDLCIDAGIEVSREEGAGDILLGNLRLKMTDGSLAAEHTGSGTSTVLFDLALDYGKADRIGVAFPDGLSAEHRSIAVGFFQALGKTVSVIDDVAGLVVMRTVAMLINEAVDALYRSVATAEDIETAMTKGVNYPIGLLEWADQLGAERILEVIENLGRINPDGRYRASPLLRRMAIESIRNRNAAGT